MIQFEEAIVDLLLRHNCVIVPSFGGFVAQSTNAVVDFRNGVMVPPRKSVLFNRQLINNDGLLLHYFADKHKLTYTESAEALKLQIANWKDALQAGQRIVIDKIGCLYLDSERNVSFEQDRFFNLLLQSYGLNKVHFLIEEDVKSIERTKQPEILVAESKSIANATAPLSISPLVINPETSDVKIAHNLPESAAKVIPLHNERQAKRAWKYIAAAALLPFAFYTYWIPMKTPVLESGVLSLRDFNPSYQAGEGVYQKKGFSFSLKKHQQEPRLFESLSDMPENENVYYFKFADDLYIPVDVTGRNKPKAIKKVVEVKKQAVVKSKETAIVSAKPVVQVKQDKKVSEIKVATTAVVADKKMHLVVGCFSTEQNAIDLTEELKAKGMNAGYKILINGMFRVTAGSSSSLAELAKYNEQAKSLGLNGWILR